MQSVEYGNQKQTLKCWRCKNGHFNGTIDIIHGMVVYLNEGETPAIAEEWEIITMNVNRTPNFETLTRPETTYDV